MNNWTRWIPFWGFKEAILTDGFLGFFSSLWHGIWITAVIMLLLYNACVAQIGYIDCAPFPAKCLVISGESFKATKEYLKEDRVWKDSINLLEEDFAGDYNFSTYTDSKEDYACYIIVFEEKLGTSLEDYLTVSHEVLHVMQFICEDYAVDFAAEKESTAYLFEHLVEETYKVINK